MLSRLTSIRPALAVLVCIATDVLPPRDSGSSLLAPLFKHTGCEEPSSAATLNCAFRSLYKGHAGFDEQDKTRELTYGEVTALGIEQFISAVPGGLSQDDVYYDLGSGVGKSVLQVFLTTAVRRASGVELAESRHLHGVGALGKLRSLVPSDADVDSKYVLDGRELTLTQGDVVTADISGGTVFFVSSLAFPNFVLRGVHERFVSQMPPGTVAAFSQKIAGCHRGLAFLRRLDIAMTWQAGSPMFLYIVTSPESAVQDLTARGSAALAPSQWGMATTQAARLGISVDANPRQWALHRSRGEEASEVGCDASDLEAFRKEGPEEAERFLQDLDITRVDAKGLSVLRHVCDMHVASVRSTAKFGKDANRKGEAFAKYQEKKQIVLESLIVALLDRGADLSSKCFEGRTALQEADDGGDEALATLLHARSAGESSGGGEL